MKKRLSEAGIRHAADVVMGDLAHTIVDQDKAKGCNLIMMGTRGMGSVASLLMRSVATKVIHLAGMPVMLVK